MKRRKWKPSSAVLGYCVSQRQWKREHRIAHAQWVLANTTEDRKPFWRDVLRVYGVKPKSVRPVKKNAPRAFSGAPEVLALAA